MNAGSDGPLSWYYLAALSADESVTDIAESIIKNHTSNTTNGS